MQYKASSMLALLLLAAVPTADAGMFLRGLFGGAGAGGESKGEAAEAQLSGIMQAAQQTLGKAERHHEKVVKRTRAEAETVLLKEAQVAGQSVARYVEELNAAAKDLSKAVSEAQQAVADSDHAEAKLISWNSPGMEERAKLGAVASMVQREVEHSLRWVQQGADAAEQRAATPFEDETTGLGRKVGDMSPIVEKAKAALHVEVVKALDEPRAVLKKVANSTSKASPADAVKAMEKTEATLNVAHAKNTNATKAAEKALSAGIDGVEKNVKADVAKMVTEVSEEQQKEIAKVKGVPAKAKPAPLSKDKKTSAPVVAKKAAPAAVVKASVPVKKALAAPVVKASAPAAVKKAAAPVVAKAVEKVVAKTK